jgi:molybdopterin converting factor small subunit
MGRPVRVLLFATARTAVGAPVLDWPVPTAGLPVHELTQALVHDHPALGPVLRTSRIVRNGRYVRGPRERVLPGDELAIHPPYGGG